MRLLLRLACAYAACGIVLIASAQAQTPLTAPSFRPGELLTLDSGSGVAKPEPDGQFSRAMRWGESEDDLYADWDEVSYRGAIFTSEIQSWRGQPDGNTPNNNGAATGLNAATRLGRLSDWTGLGYQLGASYGVYDWNGSPARPSDAQQQVFVTTGFFKRVDDLSHWSYGVVYDWMFNWNFGRYGTDPSLAQWRGQIAYATSAWNEFGVWGTLRSTSQFRRHGPFGGYFRPVEQINFFWHHKFHQGADSWIWFGFPESHRANGDGSLGDVILGGSLAVPMTNKLALVANWQYMNPSGSPSAAAARDETWFVGFGVAYYFGGRANTKSVAGNPWLPLVPLANNGNFMVDSAP